MAWYFCWAQLAQMKFLRPQTPRSRNFLDNMILLNSSQDSWENEVLFVKIEARVLDLWLDTSSGAKWPKCSFLTPGPKVNNFFEVSKFYWIHLMIFEKMRPCLWKLEPGFWTYGWIDLLGPSDSNILSRPQAQRSMNFLRFHNFIGFISWFLRKWGLVCENWSQGSGFMVGYVFWPKWLNVVSRPQTPRSKDFWRFHDFTGFIP